MNLNNLTKGREKGKEKMMAKEIIVEIIRKIKELTEDGLLKWKLDGISSFIHCECLIFKEWKICFFEQHHIDVALYHKGKRTVFCRDSHENIDLFFAIQRQRKSSLPEHFVDYKNKINTGEIVPKIEASAPYSLLKQLLEVLEQYHLLCLMGDVPG